MVRPKVQAKWMREYTRTGLKEKLIAALFFWSRFGLCGKNMRSLRAFMYLIKCLQ